MLKEAVVVKVTAPPAVGRVVTLAASEEQEMVGVDAVTVIWIVQEEMLPALKPDDEISVTVAVYDPAEA